MWLPSLRVNKVRVGGVGGSILRLGSHTRQLPIGPNKPLLLFYDKTVYKKCVQANLQKFGTP